MLDCMSCTYLVGERQWGLGFFVGWFERCSITHIYSRVYVAYK